MLLIHWNNSMQMPTLWVAQESLSW